MKITRGVPSDLKEDVGYVGVLTETAILIPGLCEHIRRVKECVPSENSPPTHANVACTLEIGDTFVSNDPKKLRKTPEKRQLRDVPAQPAPEDKVWGTTPTVAEANVLTPAYCVPYWKTLVQKSAIHHAVAYAMSATRETQRQAQPTSPPRTKEQQTDANAPSSTRPDLDDAEDMESPRLTVEYRCSRKVVTLASLVHTMRPDERWRIARLIVAQIRSLHINYEICHNALSSTSFVFYLDANGITPDLRRAYLVGWTRIRSPLYQMPGHDRAVESWLNDVYALMMILAEVLDGKLMEAKVRTPEELDRWKGDRCELLRNETRKGRKVGCIFEHGLSFVERYKTGKDGCVWGTPSKEEFTVFYEVLYIMLGL